MEDIFALDDNEVDVVSRSTTDVSSSHMREDDLNEHQVPASTIARRDQALPASGTSNNEEEGFSFDYLPARTRALSPTTAEPFNLGLDEEVVVKRRAPQAKLDDERLLGPSGIPKIRDSLSKKMVFRKGHELEDLNKFIEGYQFWAHELFPKAKFRDAIKMISKVGKSKRMKVHRRQIITELIPKPDPADVHTREQHVTQPSANNQGTAPSQEFFEDEFSMSDDEDFPIRIDSESTRPAQGLQGVSNHVSDPSPMVEVDDFDDMDALEAMGVMA